MASQFAAVELALSLSHFVAEEVADKDSDRHLSFLPIIQVGQIVDVLAQLREWASLNEQVGRLVDGLEESESALTDASGDLNALRADRAEKRDACRRAVRRLARIGPRRQWHSVGVLLEPTADAIRASERRVDEAMSWTASLLRTPGRADLQKAEWARCKEFADSALSMSVLARDTADHSWEYSTRMSPGGYAGPVRRLSFESPIELTIAVVGSVGAFVAMLDHLLSVRVRFKTRDDVEKAERARLEREISENNAAKAAAERLQRHLEIRDETELAIQEVVVSDEEFDVEPDYE